MKYDYLSLCSPEPNIIKDDRKLINATLQLLDTYIDIDLSYIVGTSEKRVFENTIRRH